MRQGNKKNSAVGTAAAAVRFFVRRQRRAYGIKFLPPAKLDLAKILQIINNMV